MPTVLDRSALEQSPLADLHLLANELGVDGFRRLRKPDLVDAILARQGGEDTGSDEPVAAAADDDSPKRSQVTARRAICWSSRCLAAECRLPMRSPAGWVLRSMCDMSARSARRVSRSSRWGRLLPAESRC